MQINPLLKHPILQHLPYSQLKNPTLEGVQSFLAKRRKLFKVMKYLTLVPIAIQLYFMFPTGGTGNSQHGAPLIKYLEDIFRIVLTLALALVFHKSERQYLLSDEEIQRSIQSVRAQENQRTA